MRSRFLVENNITTKDEFIYQCSIKKAKSLTELAKFTSQTRGTLYKIINHFELNESEKQALLQSYVRGFSDEINPYLIAPDNLDKGGTFHRFIFQGALFYVYMYRERGAEILRYRRGKLSPASERTIKSGNQLYFKDANGNMNYVMKRNFMYCFFHDLQDIPAAKKVIEVGNWHEKEGLKLVDIAANKKDARDRAIERAIEGFMSGHKHEALRELAEFIESEIRERDEKNKS